MDIKADGVYKIAKNTFGKYLHSKYIYPLLVIDSSDDPS
jgi:hypothetical protein